MKKLTHVLVIVFLALAGASLWFEIELNSQRALLTDRNRLQEDYFVKIAKTVEKVDPAKDAAFEIKKDASPVEARLVDSPDMEDVLEDYQGSLEQANLETYDWANMNARTQLRNVYVTDAEGKPVKDGNEFLKQGPGTEDELLAKLFESAKAQQSRLNSTRDALAKMRDKLAGVVNELNKLKPEARQDKVTIEEQKEQITKLEEDKTTLEGQVTKVKGQINELNGEIASMKDEISSAKDETEAVKGELEKSNKLVAQLKQMLKEAIQTRGAASAGAASAISSLSHGDKGKIIEADNDMMFAVVEVSNDTMIELKGENRDKPLPLIELGVRRPGYNGAAGEFVGRVRLRQEVRGKNYIICDIIGSWEQSKLLPNDVLFAD